MFYFRLVFLSFVCFSTFNLIQSDVYAALSTTHISEIRNVVAACGKDFTATKEKFDQWIPGSVRSSVKTGGSVLGALTQKLSSTEKAKAEEKKEDVKKKIEAFNTYYKKESDSWFNVEKNYLSLEVMAKETESQIRSLGGTVPKKSDGIQFLEASSAVNLENFKNKCQKDLSEINALIGK
jgi:hypothetical protein